MKDQLRSFNNGQLPKLLKLTFLFFAACFISINASAQEKISVSGTVTDSSEQPLPGVAVVEQGTTNGITTDIEGKYTISVDANAVITFTFMGMETKNVLVNGQTAIDVILAESSLMLDEVIAVGYGVQKKETLTGAVGSIKPDELVQRPVANSTELLQGQISGITTRQQSGLPGADGTTIRIRGFASAPLVMIDGIEGALSQVDPNDIESLSVLKDAAAIYGARAGNGVILVTTKRGSSGKASINYHGTFSMAAPTALPEQVSALQWAELMHEAGLEPNDYSPGHVSYDPENNTLTNLVDGSDYEGSDWMDAIYKDWAPQQQHNLNARGGSDKIKYFISAGFTDQESAF